MVNARIWRCIKAVTNVSNIFTFSQLQYVYFINVHHKYVHCRRYELQYGIIISAKCFDDFINFFIHEKFQQLCMFLDADAL